MNGEKGSIFTLTLSEEPKLPKEISVSEAVTIRLSDAIAAMPTVTLCPQSEGFGRLNGPGEYCTTCLSG